MPYKGPDRSIVYYTILLPQHPKALESYRLLELLLQPAVDKERLYPRKASFISMRTIYMTVLEMVKSPNPKLVPSNCYDSKANNSCAEVNFFTKT